MKQGEWLHDLRAPLQLIYSCAQLLETEIGEDESARSHVELLLSSTREMQKMLSMAMEQLRPGAEENHPVRSEIVARTWETLARCRLAAERRNIRLSFHANTDRLEWILDEGKYSRILINLISNALKYTPDGGEVRVDVRALGDAAEISVTDNGCGIAPERLGKIFDLYETDTGYGYGLHIARNLSACIGGTLNVTSVPGKGSTFTLRLVRECAGEEVPV